MALDRPHLRGVPGLRFARLLGTGSGRTFTIQDADPHRWALFAVWASAGDAEAFEGSATMRGWSRLAEERWRLELTPTRCRGLWSGRDPFAPRGQVSGQIITLGTADSGTADSGTAEPPGATDAPGGPAPLAALTRARLTARGARRFWRSVPAVAGELAHCTGLRFAVGIGEAPVGTQGTLSVWDDAAAMSEFAYRTQAHAEVIRRTAEVGWYAEELFARFVVTGSRGTVDGAQPLTKR